MALSLRKLMLQYEDVFEDTFPTMNYSGCSNDELIEIIRECINTNTPIADTPNNIYV